VPRPLRVAALVLATAGLAAFAGGCDVNEDNDLDRGRALFQSKCGTCHALAEAGTSAQIAPDLDAAFAKSREDGMDNDTIEGVVQAQIANPRAVAEGDPEYSATFMPADLVTGKDAEDVSAYVASVAGVPGAAPPELPPDQLFTERCGSCHALEAAGTSGSTGPDLDEVLAGKDARYIEKQIVDPNSEITQGFSPDVMPQDFGQTLTSQDIQGLVDFLLQSIGGGSGGS
jgi:mono/diheme cytochrome c family protein